MNDSLAGAFVPRWHAIPPASDNSVHWRRWTVCFAEILLHGWTHRREYRPGLVSLITGRADELAGLPPRDVVARVAAGRSELEEIVGRPITGFVPPAWQLPGGFAALRETGIQYSVGFRRLDSSQPLSIPLATYSWDWGRLPLVGRLGAQLGTCSRLITPRAVPVIVLHPADVDRGSVATAVARIRQLKNAGWQAVRFAGLMSADSRRETA
ncbi:MAG: hypothetical protein NT069_01885 [Planctomycetota bacterium]|nr:hypothetical protein [Planctomycetota bacterium]